MSGWSRSNIWDPPFVWVHRCVSISASQRFVTPATFSYHLETLMFMIFLLSYLSNFFPILFRLAPLTILGAIMFKVFSPCLILVEEISFGVVHFLSLAVIFVFEFGFFFFGGESNALALGLLIDRKTEALCGDR